MEAMRYDERESRHARMTSSNLCPALFQNAVYCISDTPMCKSSDYSLNTVWCIKMSITRIVPGAPRPMPNLPRLLYPNFIFYNSSLFHERYASYIFAQHTVISCTTVGVGA